MYRLQQSFPVISVFSVRKGKLCAKAAELL
jgi:hypothetical protein